MPPHTGRIEYIDEKDKAGKLVGRYIKGKLLGKGGFAKCYEVTHCTTKEEYAMKVISKSTLTKPKTRQKLKTEIKIHRSIEHKYIVSFKKYFEDDQNVYILLELCRGQTVLDLSTRKGRFTELEASYLIHQCLLALQYMHMLGIIHRDLKLGNIMLTSDMNVKIGDFGLAARLYFAGEKRRTLCGTPNYIAPEILASGHGHSFEVDIWTIGVILYALLVGKPPFQTADVNTTYGKIKKCSYTYPPDCKVSKEARDLIGRILQVTPEGRPSLEQIMDDPWFKMYPPKKLAPLSLFTPGTPAYATQQQRLQDEGHPVACRVAKPTKPGRIPLGSLNPNVNTLHVGQVRPRTTSASRHQQRFQVSPPIAGAIFSRGRDRDRDHNIPARYRSAGMPIQSSSPSPRSAAPVICVPASPYSGSVSPPRKSHLLPTRSTSAIPQCLSLGGRVLSPARHASSSRSPSAHVGSVTPLVPPCLGQENESHPLATDQEDDKNLTQIRERLDETPALHETRVRGREDGALHQSPPACALSSPSPSPVKLDDPTIWVTEYADFTAKYGLAYRFSNGQIGVHFNDNTKMVYSPRTLDVWYVVRFKSGPLQGTDQITHCKLGEHGDELNKKVTLIKYFCSYIAKVKGRILKEGQQEVVVCSKAPVSPANMQPDELVYVRKWLKTSDATIFRLSNRKVQVCFHDSTEIILSSEARLVTYTDQKGDRNTFSLSLMSSNAQPDIASRLRYTKDIIGRLVQVNTKS